MLQKCHDILRRLCTVRDQPVDVIRGLPLYTKRVKFILNFLIEDNIQFTVDNFKYDHHGHFSNIYVPVNGMKHDKTLILMAHHDVYNTFFENANDNSASVAILLKLASLFNNVENLKFNLVFVFTDSEEYGFYGAHRLVQEFEKGFFSNTDLIHGINLELCGIGNNLWIEHTDNKYVSEKLTESEGKEFKIVGCPINDAKFIRDNFEGYNNFTTIGLLPDKNGELNFSPWSKIHTIRDSFEDMSSDDMESLVMILKNLIISLNNN